MTGVNGGAYLHVEVHVKVHVHVEDHVNVNVLDFRATLGLRGKPALLHTP